MGEFFLKNPNLPEGKVKSVIIGESHADVLGAALMPYGVRVIPCPENPRLDPRLASHADLSAIHLGGNRLLVSRAVCRADFVSALEGLGIEIELADSPSGAEYPADCGLCALIMGANIFHNLKHSDKALLGETMYKQTYVNQGYAKCAVCPVGSRAAISSDAGMAKALLASGIDVLAVSAEGVWLNGYKNGFFGGSAFFIAKDTLAFTGVLETCTDKDRIEKFLEKYGVTPVYLSDMPVFDIGSAIPLTENRSISIVDKNSD